MPLRLKILLACLMLTAMTVTVGVLAMRTEAQLSQLTLQMYDKAFMSIDYMRSAQTEFERLRAAYSDTQTSSERQRLIAQARADHGGTDVNVSQAAALPAAVSQITDDLDVAIERATSANSQTMAVALRRSVTGITAGAAADFGGIGKQFERVAEQFSQDGFAARSKATELTDSSRRSSRLAIFSSVALALVTSLILSENVVPSIRRAARFAGRIADGDLDADIVLPRQAGRSETASLTLALDRMRTAIRENLARIKLLNEAEAQERQRSEADKNMALQAMAETIEREAGAAVARISEQTNAMTRIADTMKTNAARTGAKARNAEASAEQALSQMRTISASAEDLTASITTITEHVTRSTQLVSESKEIGEDARGAMNTLAERIGQIGIVSDLINDIASRTNLLALNATIEAARAGEAGRGFAVVASEVKSLAHQTAGSTNEIGRHISEVRAASTRAVEAVSRIEHTLANLDELAALIVSAVEQQGIATGEIGGSLSGSATSARELALLISGVASESDTTGVQSSDVHGRAMELFAAVGSLSQTVVRVVRTSTDATDRRQHERQAISIDCSVRFGGDPECSGLVENLSEGGAMIALPVSAAIADTGILTLRHYALDLPFHVRAQEMNAETRRINVSFHADDASSARLAEVIQQVTCGTLLAA